MDCLITFLAELFIDLLDLFAEYLFKPTYSFKKLTDITDEVLEEMKEKHNIKGIILDVDETIRFNMGLVSKENDEWIDDVTSKFKVIVVTNGLDHSINSYFKKKGIKVFCRAFKPLKKYFKKAMEELELPANEILVIGDNSFTDVLGGNRMKMTTCKVKNHKGFKLRNRQPKYFRK